MTALIKNVVMALTLTMIGAASAQKTVFDPPGGPCETSEDCYRAYFCSSGMCTYGRR